MTKKKTSNNVDNRRSWVLRREGRHLFRRQNEGTHQVNQIHFLIRHFVSFLMKKPAGIVFMTLHFLRYLRMAISECYIILG
jgi:hypothetical protein